MENVWRKILSELEIEVSKGVFHAMFKNTALLSLEDNVATVATSSPMVSNFIEKRYYSLLQKLLKKHLEKEDVSIVFTERGQMPSEDKRENLPLFPNKDHPTSIFSGKRARLHPDFTFENFAVSSTNQLAFACAETCAKNPGTSYNPLFFYGSVGVGKTHLMQAIGASVLSLFPEKKVLYQTSEDFTNDLVESIRSKTTSFFRKKHRGIDVLLLDDVQFLAGKEKVQEELFHTFNSLVSGDKQVVLSSDKPPTELDKIEKRLKSRFSGGLTVDIAPPDMELRCAILLIKARRRRVDLPMDVVKKIAFKIEDTRLLEGVLNRFVSEFTHNGEDASEKFLASILRSETVTNGQKRILSDDVLSAVCRFYNIKPTHLMGKKRDRPSVLPRHIAMYLLKTELGKTLVEIGNILGGRDHTTVMYGVSKIEKESLSSKIHEDVMGIKKIIWG